MVRVLFYLRVMRRVLRRVTSNRFFSFLHGAYRVTGWLLLIVKSSMALIKKNRKILFLATIAIGVVCMRYFPEPTSWFLLGVIATLLVIALFDYFQ